MNSLLFEQILDLGGTFVFATSGAVAAVYHRLDLFGVLVLSFVAGNFGGITRDVLIGAVPPAAIANERYLLVSVFAGLLTFYAYSINYRLRTHMLILDAIGLSFFAVAGAQRSLSFGLSPVPAALLGMLTGIGGGMLRDILVREIPQVLRGHLYAVAALAGSSVIVIADLLSIPYAISAPIGGVLCLVIRLVAMRKRWQLPVPSDAAREKLKSMASGDD